MGGHADIPSMYDVMARSGPTDDATLRKAKLAVLRRFETGQLTARETLDILRALGIAPAPAPTVLPVLSLDQRRAALTPKEA